MESLIDMEKECPLCYSLIDVTNMKEHDTIVCHGCGEILEYVNEELVAT